MAEVDRMTGKEEVPKSEKARSLPGLLLHTCCGPCATGVLESLAEEYEMTCFFYNPNVQPESEYRTRLDQAREVARIMKVLFLDDEYDADAWLEETKGLKDEPEGGRRCEICFRKRLLKTGIKAKQVGADLFATTLTISPHKNAGLINRTGNYVSQKVGVPFLEGDWKRAGGFKRSVELSEEFSLVRQDYCGCEYSRRG
ncbi:MAG: epoxyqueuosine reductase QueH [bacterium]